MSDCEPVSAAWRGPAAYLCGCLGLLLSLPASAQTPSPLPEWIFSSGQQLRVYYMWDKLPKWEYNVGASVELQPKFSGSKQYRIQAGPSFDVRYRDIAFLSTGEGLGINIWHGKTYRVGTAITYDLGRAEDRSYRLRGLGDVQPGPELKLYGEFVWFPVTFRADVRRAIGGYNGWVSDLSVYSPIVGSKTFFVLVGPAVSFADHNYMINYFGIDAEQSAQSGYPQFSPHAGLKSASFGANVNWFFYKQWYLNATMAAERLFGDAAESPTTATRVQGVGSLTIGYDFR